MGEAPSLGDFTLDPIIPAADDEFTTKEVPPAHRVGSHTYGGGPGWKTIRIVRLTDGAGLKLVSPG